MGRRAGGVPLLTPPPAPPAPRRLAALARLLDDAVRIPGTRVGVGLDALLGLVPGVGDWAGALLSGYLVLEAARLGVPAPVLARMVLNVGVDAVLGAVPLLGDLFDVGWKANARNLALLRDALDAPAAARRSSALVVGATLLALAAVLGGVGVLAVLAVGALRGWIAG